MRFWLLLCIAAALAGCVPETETVFTENASAEQVLVDAGFIVTVRTTRGDDIDAACGQLVGEVVDRTRRSERHRARQAAALELAQ